MDENKKENKKEDKDRKIFRENQISIRRKGLCTVKKPPVINDETVRVMLNLVRMVRKNKFR